MYSAFRARCMTAGHDGLRGSGSQHCGALGWRDDAAEFPDPGPDHFAVAFLGAPCSACLRPGSIEGRGFAPFAQTAARGAYSWPEVKTAQTILAVLAACAITATFIGRLARMPRCH